VTGSWTLDDREDEWKRLAEEETGKERDECDVGGREVVGSWTLDDTDALSDADALFDTAMETDTREVKRGPTSLPNESPSDDELVSTVEDEAVVDFLPVDFGVFGADDLCRLCTKSTQSILQA